MSGLEWTCEVLFERGKLRGNRHVVLGTKVRGKLSIKEQDDGGRHRRVRVATMYAVRDGREPPSPLYDAKVIALDHWLRITGYERIKDGTLAEEHGYVQTWHLTPGPTEDLLHFHSEVRRLTTLCTQNGIDPRQQPRPEVQDHPVDGSRRRWGKTTG